MRNHLSICELYGEIIRKNLEKDGYENESVENALQCIKKSLKIMGHSLLDLKSLDNVNLKALDLTALIETAVAIARVYAPEMKFVCDYTEGIIIEADEHKFLGCLVNILKNATEAGASEIRVSTSATGGIIKINISNNGNPVAPEKIAEIFSEGFTTKQTGSGLGLYICRQNLALQGAQLHLVKSDKISTEFEIKILPLFQEGFA